MDWSLTDRIRSVCSDTERVNTGRLGGVYRRLEHKLNRDLIYLPCRHHILEVILSAAFRTTLERKDKSTAPTIKYFEDFAVRYVNPQFRPEDFHGCMKDRFFSVFFNSDEKQELKEFCQRSLSLLQNATRSDHLELLKLVILFLSNDDDGGISCSRNRIYPPGAYNRARFMARIIYSFKIYLYREQLGWNSTIINNLRRFILFVLKVYLKCWFMSNNAITAPRQDLNMLKQIVILQECLPITAVAAFDKLKNHLWYLSERLVALSFFDPEVSDETKSKMARKLSQNSIQLNDHNRWELAEVSNDAINNLNLWDFVSKETYRFFECLGINTDFLFAAPNEWYLNVNFIEARRVVNRLTVVNDGAERSIALYKSHSSLTVNEENKENVLQVVEKNRKDYHRLTKSNIIDKLRDTNSN